MASLGQAFALVGGLAVVVLFGTVGATLLAAPRVAALAGAGAERWWLRRWAQGLFVALAVALVIIRGPLPFWLGGAVGFAAATLACLVDAASHRLPDVLTLRVGAVGLGLAAAATAYFIGVSGLLCAIIGVGIGGGLLGALALAYPPGMGLGDVKLGALLGGLVGTAAAVTVPDARLGSATLAAGTMLVVAFVLGGLVSLALLIARRVARRDAVPFGPFLLLGALVALTL